MSNKHAMQADLKGKVALITGASQGLGAYYAEVLAKNGASVVVGGRSMEKLNNVCRKMSEKGSKALPIILDMNDLESFDRNNS